jgi:Fe2+ or Zn2+ uptake regulation protein
MVILQGWARPLDLWDNEKHGVHMTAQRINEIASLIERYLADHPSAEDTLEGVSNFWLKMQRVEVTDSEVEQALERLVAMGRVRKKHLPDGRTIYAGLG